MFIVVPETFFSSAEHQENKKEKKKYSSISSKNSSENSSKSPPFFFGGIFRRSFGGNGKPAPNALYEKLLHRCTVVKNEELCELLCSCSLTVNFLWKMCRWVAFKIRKMLKKGAEERKIYKIHKKLSSKIVSRMGQKKVNDHKTKSNSVN